MLRSVASSGNPRLEVGHRSLENSGEFVADGPQEFERQSVL